MEIIKKIAAKNKDVYSGRPACIAFLGDSVTQGCFELYQTSDSTLETYFDQSSAYHAYLKQRLAEIFPASPVVIVNAGISGDNATQALGRLERDVLSFKPDLVVVCFGLNDCTSGINGIETYRNSMARIIASVKETGAEVIVMTPCNMADHVSIHVKNEQHRYPFVAKCVEGITSFTNDGVLDRYVEVARAVAKEAGVPVCDAYARWKRLSELGADTTELLANKANHPSREMNKMFSDLLLYTMIDN
jgi:lysophospholipase L1-like esterase